MPERRSRPIHARRYLRHDDPPASYPRNEESTARPRSIDAAYAPGHAALERGYAAQLRRRSRETLIPPYPGSLDDLSRLDDETQNARRRPRSPSFAEDIFDARDRGALTHDYEELTQQYAKRRRLGVDATPVPTPPRKYGHYGQVEPGRLRMIMISCDGGQYNDPRSGIYLGCHNVLRHDRTVYCSSRKDPILILRHADDTPFSLKSLSIVAPGPGFTAPVKRGTVHVSMSLAALGKYTDRPDTTSHQRLSNDTLTTLSSSEDDDDSISEASIGQDNAPGLQQDADLGEETPTSPEWLEYLQQRASTVQRRTDTSRWRERRLNRSLPLTDNHSPQPDREWLADTFREAMSRHTTQLSPEPRSRDSATQTDLDHFHQPMHSDTDLEVTTAQFCMAAKDQRSVTLNFDTAITGRFILLKLESAEPAYNVDVQSILVTGFAGPRFFPTTQLR